MARWRDGTGTLTITDRDGVTETHVPLRIAASFRHRTRGLLGRDGVDGALMITPCGSVHSFRMRFAIDVAYLDGRFNVLEIHTMRPGRLGLPRPRGRHVIEAEAGAMAAWGMRPGSQVRIVQHAVDG
ncbi:DUF192 domain-containing protein [Streptomyces sp. NBC_00525]|uniref:DUF192 domain-containing protein n=1 Tax=Streptomyces sp. NBC_00525 TaxID=2903660 RepID=UPI002E80355E|nr:DUF192 domain-containing protein [Streptomyces sp. NBC_00525]WUC95682.1 DUF192 domain-containing protein [Streptomyces sp. NBC_00525]